MSPTLQADALLLPGQGLNLCPLQWKCGVLTVGPPGKSPLGCPERRMIFLWWNGLGMWVCYEESLQLSAFMWSVVEKILMDSLKSPSHHQSKDLEWVGWGGFWVNFNVSLAISHKTFTASQSANFSEMIDFHPARGKKNLLLKLTV